MMEINYTRTGRGKPLLLIHGLGSSRRAWSPVIPLLQGERELIAIDLPGHGTTPAQADSGTFAGLARSLEEWLCSEGLADTDMVGSSMGARLVLEMARRGRCGASVALDPGGFWAGWERAYLSTTLRSSVLLLRGLRRMLPRLSHNVASRTALLAQLSARPWALDGDLVESELTSFAGTATFDALVKDLAYGPLQKGPAAPRAGRVTIGWGRHDRLCFPVQAGRAMKTFPEAQLVWFDKSGHFPMWDQPEDTAATILRATG
ncbi:MAG TPA: alpha/beta hydrolase [Allosphingosinicella sp.]|nr:alpha/beta hydrolase [Allosphingosinicella sp.]